MKIIDINTYKKNKKEENRYESTSIEDIDLEAALGSAIFGDEPGNKLQERYNETQNKLVLFVRRWK